MNLMDLNIARCEEQRKAFEAQLLSIEQQKQELNHLPMSDSGRQAQEGALAERENLARTGLDQTVRELDTWKKARDEVERVLGDDNLNKIITPSTLEQTAQDMTLAEKQIQTTELREVQGVKFGDEVQKATDVMEQVAVERAKTPQGSEYVAVTNPPSHENYKVENMTDPMLSTTMALVGAAEVAKATHERYKQGQEQRIDQAIKDNPPSEKQIKDNDVLAEIERTDKEKWQQHEVDKVKGSCEKQHASIDKNYETAKEHINKEQTQALQNGDEDRAKQCDDKLSALEGQRDKMREAADREAKARLEQLQREAAERQRQDNDRER